MNRTLVVTDRMTKYPTDSHTFDRYQATGGYAAARRASGMTRDELVEMIKGSGLLGRGGAAFSAGFKWSFLAPGRPSYLVVNADESEPGTFKDRQLLERDPHQMLEGIIITAIANEVHHAFIYIRGEYPKPARRVQQAVAEAYRSGYLGKGIFDSGFDLEVTVHLGAGAYICGEETALINSLEGLRGEPRLKPPYFPAAVGLYNKPTIVNNVETLSNLPHILNDGVDAFKALGHETDTGTFLFSISGHVQNPGNFELAHGLTWRELIYEVAGGMPAGRQLKTWIPGGASAPWFVPADHLDLPITKDDTAKAGSMLGSGAVVVMDDTTCVVRAAERIGPLLRPRVLRPVHSVSGGDQLAGVCPQANRERAGKAGRLRLVAGHLRQHLGGTRLASEDDDHLPARALGGFSRSSRSPSTSRMRSWPTSTKAVARSSAGGE